MIGKSVKKKQIDSYSRIIYSKHMFSYTKQCFSFSINDDDDDDSNDDCILYTHKHTE